MLHRLRMPSRCLIAILLITLVWAQAFGLWHRQVHANTLEQTAGLRASRLIAGPANVGVIAENPNTLLDHDGTLCNLLDHHLLDSSPPVTFDARPLSPPQPQQLALTPVFSPKTDPTLAFLARGPPIFA